MHFPKQSDDVSNDPSSKRSISMANHWLVSLQATANLHRKAKNKLAGKFCWSQTLRTVTISTLLLTPAFAGHEPIREPSSIQYNEDQCRAQYRKMDPFDLKQGGCFNENTRHGNCFHAFDQWSAIAQITDENCLAILADIVFNIHSAPWVWENRMSFDQFKQNLAYQLLQNVMFAQSLNALEHAEIEKVSKGAVQ